jgi:hypothetical protein
MTAGKLGVLGLVTLGCILGGCTSEAEHVADKEDLLAAAGFNVLPASTPTRQQEISGLPAHHFLSQIKGDNVVYLYADPLVCNCLYVGNQAAYDRYRQEVFQRQIADEQQVTAEVLDDDSWDWGPWGPGWWWGP